MRLPPRNSETTRQTSTSPTIRNGLVLDELHLSDVLLALRNAGYSIHRKTGLLYSDVTHPAG